MSSLRRLADLDGILQWSSAKLARSEPILRWFEAGLNILVIPILTLA
ncbi:hypothetical protein ABIF69_004527 [Bradyrhizobium japonicum]